MNKDRYRYASIRGRVVAADRDLASKIVKVQNEGLGSGARPILIGLWIGIGFIQHRNWRLSSWMTLLSSA
jgi:hypothetical protein